MLRWMFTLLLGLALAVPAWAVSFSEESGGSLSTTAAKLTLDGAHGGIVPPRKVDIGLVTCELSSVSGATSIIWWLTRDSTGDKPITPRKTSTINTGQTAGTGGVAETVDAKLLTDATAIYVWAKTDAGTATVVLCRAYWEAA